LGYASLPDIFLNPLGRSNHIAQSAGSSRLFFLSLDLAAQNVQYVCFRLNVILYFIDIRLSFLLFGDGLQIR
jgi:hypothetical protein